jgi:hypothetical protein
MSVVGIIENKSRNFLLNGDFAINQRYGSGASTTITAGACHTDRWCNWLTGGGTFQVLRGTSTPPLGSGTYCRLVGTTNLALDFGQVLESNMVDQLKGKTVTFSVLLRRTSGWTQAVNLRVYKNASANTRNGGSWTQIGATAISVANITASTANVSDWKQFSVTVDVPNDGTANGLSVVINWGTQAAAGELQIAQAMLNVGGGPTQFSLAGQSFTQEVILCQRFYEKSYALEQDPTTGGGSADGLVVFGTATIANTDIFGSVAYRVPKRTGPTTLIRPYTTPTNTGRVSNATAGTDLAAGSGTTLFNGMGGFSVQNASGGAISISVSFHWTADAEFA